MLIPFLVFSIEWVYCSLGFHRYSVVAVVVRAVSLTSSWLTAINVARICYECMSRAIEKRIDAGNMTGLHERVVS